MYVGGIVGKIYQGGTIKSCYQNGSVKGTTMVGGIVGLVQKDSLTVDISSCYHSGTVSATTTDSENAEYIGGIVGRSELGENPINILNCYFLNGDAPSGVAGTYTKCTAIPITSAMLRVAFEDLGSPFIENTNKEFNNGYPVFEWQTGTKTIVGDVNGDNQITVSDAILVARIVAEDHTVKVSEQGMKNADCDGKDGITADDATYLLKLIAGIDV